MASPGFRRPGGGSEAGAREQTRAVQLLLAAEHDDPFSFLGMHPRPDGALGVRVFRPDCRAVTVRAPDGSRFESRRIHAEGLFEAVIPRRDPFPYELEITGGGGEATVERDPYSFPPLTGDYDRYLFNEGTHCEADGFLGAHRRAPGGCDGVAFALWAPAASRVSVVGDFNDWDGRRHPMRHRRGSGIWELFVPHLGAGALYKYEIRTAAGDLLLKADPCAFRTEAPPRTASVVCDVTAFEWSDAGWMGRRGERDWSREPLAIYEVHLGSWRRGEQGRPLGYRELARELVEYVAALGYTHLELMPVAEHPSGAPGDTRSAATSPRPPATGSRRISPGSSICATAAASASSSTGCRAIFPTTPTAWAASTEPICTSTPTRAGGGTRTGGPRSSTSGAAKS